MDKTNYLIDWKKGVKPELKNDGTYMVVFYTTGNNKVYIQLATKDERVAGKIAENIKGLHVDSAFLGDEKNE
jgi:hypothetical protein